VSNEIEAARRQAEADGLARFLVEETRNEPRLPKGVRVMIDERVQEYYRKRYSRTRWRRHEDKGEFFDELREREIHG
jgi:hypothetical protein